MPVTLHVWRVPRHRIGSAWLRIAFRRNQPGVRFVKFLGTGSGFEPKNADLTRYAAITVSDTPVEYPTWDRLAVQRATVDLEPLSSRGTWSGKTPFAPQRRKSDGMVLAITRARLRPTRAIAFYR